MKNIQPVRITLLNGTVSNHEVDLYSLPTLLGTLDMSRVASIEYGEAIINKGPAEVRLSGLEFSYDKTSGKYWFSAYDRNDQRVAQGGFEPVKLQQFAVNLLQQTTYRFVDVQDDYGNLKHRMDGLEK